MKKRKKKQRTGKTKETKKKKDQREAKSESAQLSECLTVSIKQKNSKHQKLSIGYLLLGDWLVLASFS